MWTPGDFRVNFKDNTLQFIDENNIHSPTLSSIPSDNEQSLLSDLSAVPDDIVNDISLLDTSNTPYVDREEEQDTQRILQDSIDSEPILQRAGDPGQHLSLKRHKYNKAKRGLKRSKISDNFKKTLSDIPENESLVSENPVNIQDTLVTQRDLPHVAASRLKKSYKQWPSPGSLTPHQGELSSSIESKFNDDECRHQPHALTHVDTQSESRTHDSEWLPPAGYKNVVSSGTIRDRLRPRRVSLPSGAPSSSSSHLPRALHSPTVDEHSEAPFLSSHPSPVLHSTPQDQVAGETSGTSVSETLPQKKKDLTSVLSKRKPKEVWVTSKQIKKA